MDRIKSLPNASTTYNPSEPAYWDRAALDEELTRVFEICHGCRLCFGLCPSFNELFEFVDRHDGQVRHLDRAETNRVLDTCYQCKLCYPKCPYTPDEEHEFRLDFPRLVQRAVNIRARTEGICLRDRLLARPDTVGRWGSFAAGLANFAGRQPVLRGALQVILGVHREKILPEFFSESFESWVRKQPAVEGDSSLAVLFFTCFVNFNQPQLGKTTLEVFSKNGVALRCPRQNCCGMPALEAGEFELAKKLATDNVSSLLPEVEAGKKIVAINPTCSYMLRMEYPEIVGTPAAQKVAGAAMDLCAFLFQRKQQGLFNRNFRSSPGRVGYHLPCHLKAQKIGYRSRDLLRLIPETTVRLVDQCSGHDGTWAMKKEFFPLSMLAGKKAFDTMAAAEPETMVSDCPLAAVQFEQALGMRPIHPMEVLARAYRADGFPKFLEVDDESR